MAHCLYADSILIIYLDKHIAWFSSVSVDEILEIHQVPAGRFETYYSQGVLTADYIEVIVEHAA
jgi:hypothetical protein